ncbi:MAG: hypothetical protein IT306_07645 [Chloroflexi bacterium]|nr:hypothetical protein [Chloroflexota bacterium]
MLAALLFLGASTRADACSPVPGYHINQNDVIVEGWVENVEIGESSTQDSFLPVRVTMRVQRAWKGAVPARIDFVDAASYVANSAGIGGGVWAGSSGACGALDVDPTGRYGLVVFKTVNGELKTSNVQGAVFGDSPADPLVERFRRYVQDNVHPAEPPRILPETDAPPVDQRSIWWGLGGMVGLMAAGSVLGLLVIRALGRRQDGRVE